MKYRITKENIEFQIEETRIFSLVKSILEVLVPNKFRKLYFSGLPENDYSALRTLNKNGLVILGKGDLETLLKRERIVHNNEHIVLVPVLSGIVKHSEWKPVCEKIIHNAAKYV